MTTPFDDPHAELAWMFLQCLSDGGDVDECFTLLSDDFTHWSIITRKSIGRAALRREVERRKCDLRINFDLIRCVKDGESVVIEAQAEFVTVDGMRYDSPFVFIVETRDGLITSVREYSDTRVAAQVFG
ncbi:MAG: nuclear transport factor 2 family protein [Mycobacterium sp.]